MRARTRTIEGNYWPGFVDALTTLLMVIIFLLVVFVLAQVVLSQAITGKDAALDRLNRRVSELADLLSIERQANADLRLNIAQLSSSLQSAVAARDDLIVRLDQLTTRAEEMERRAKVAEQALLDAESTVDVDKETIELRLREIESLRRDISALREVRGQLEERVAQAAAALEDSETRARALNQALQQSQAEVGQLRDRAKELDAKLADAGERTLLAQKELKERDIRLEELLANYQRVDRSYQDEKQLSKQARSQVEHLNQQIAILRNELERLSAILEAAEARDRESEATISDLGRRLNRALASKVEELSRFRSEFFGRLREILGERQDIEIVGDRFVFQSEVLFESGSAQLGGTGQLQLTVLAETLLQISEEIPNEIDWVLRVDGHTDRIPIETARFPSNWELSAARAISVVKYLMAWGVPARRLAATGFGEHQPLDDRDDEIAHRRNRRIELKLTQR